MSLPSPIFASRAAAPPRGPLALILRAILGIILLVLAAVVVLPIAAAVLIVALVVAGIIVALNKARRAWRMLTRRDGQGRQNVRVINPNP